MFVGKGELGNIKSLLKIRNKECTGINYIYYLLAFLFVMDLIGLIRGVFVYRPEAVSISLQPYSNWSFVLMMIACLFYTVNYKDYDYRHQIYPQTNKSRYISHMLFCYLSFIKTQAAALGLYLLQCGICVILDRIKGNIDYAYPFSLFFLVTGFCVILLYGFIIIALIVLLGALDRKFNWVFRILFVGGLVILLITKGVNWLINGINFLKKEYSLPLFMLKALAIWLCLLLLGYIINKLTRYYKFQKKFRYYHAIVIALLLIFVFIKISVTPTQPYFGYSSYSSEDMTESLIDNAKYQVDVSDIPDGTVLSVKMSQEDRNRTYPVPGQTQTKYPDKLLINYTPPVNMINEVDLNAFTKPELIITLKDNVLAIRIASLENRKVIMMYPFSFLQNFNYFKDNNYYKKKLGSSSGSGSGSIYLFTPEEKNLTISQLN